MNEKFSKILTLIAGAIGIIGLVFFFRIMALGDDAIISQLASGADDGVVGPFIWFSIIVLVVTVAIAVFYSLVNLLKQPEVLKRSLIGVGILVAILVIAYFLASDAAVTDSVGNVLPDGEAGSVSKWVGTGIIYTGILGLIGFVAFFADFVKSLLKN